MIKLLFTGLLVILCFKVQAQLLKGRVYQSGTDQIIPQASVYYNNTLTGTITNNNGDFELELKPGKNVITISCVGYYSAEITDYTAGQLLKIYLSPKVQQLREVVIGNDGMSADEKLNLFKKEFIGTSEFALSCSIINVDDLNLVYNKSTQTLTATSDKPIEIENKKLGYHISYFLNQFEKSPRHTTFSGSLIFKEAADIINQRTIARNREKAYTGSRMQLIRALWHNTLKKTSFEIYTPYSKLTTADSIVKESINHEKFINLKNGISIRYATSDEIRISRLAKTDKPCYIDQYGFSDANLKWAGNMGVQRVGDMLPFEYKAPKEKYNDVDVQSVGFTAAPDTVKKETIHQTDSKDRLDGLFFEKAYLHSDRDIYQAGDDVWFKAYLVNAQNNQLSDTSNNLYVELILPQAEIVHQEIIRLENGTGNGDFKLANTMLAGKYRLRAYTNWMRNFGDKFIFEKGITIVDDWAGQSAPQTGRNVKNKIKFASAKDTSQRGVTVRFFPEGGYLVNDVNSVIAVKAEDEFGHGIAAIGDIVTLSGNKIAKFTCDPSGMGTFQIKPEQTQQYHAEVTIKGKLYQFKIPPALHKGFVLSVNAKPGIITASINCDGLFTDPSGSELVIMVQHTGITYHKQRFTINTKNALIEIPDTDFPEGIACITLLNEQDKPLSERLIYVHHAGNVNMNITTNKVIYQPKEKVTVKIKLSDPTKAHLSFAAVDAGSIPVRAESILSYLNLRSEVKGSIEQAEKYFDTTNVNRFQQLDMLLLTQGWRSYLWERLADTIPKITYNVEQGITLTGYVRQVFGNKPLAGMSITMFAPKAEKQKLFSTVTDSLGRFSIAGALIYGYQFINFTSRNASMMKDGKSRGNSSGWIQVDSLDNKKLPVYPAFVNIIDSVGLKPDSLLESKNAKRKFSFNDNNELKTVQINKINNNPPPEIHNIGASEQKDFGSLMHYLLYMIPNAHEEEGGCRIDTRRNRQILTFGNFPSHKIAIIGVYSDHSKIDYRAVCDEDYLNQPMINVLKVTINHPARGGVFVFVVLKPGVLEKRDNFDNTTADITGYYKAREFFSPRYETVDTVPDYRTTIHWEPNITTDKNGEATLTYYNADPKTKIRLIVQGITDSGVPVVASAGYVVK